MSQEAAVLKRQQLEREIHGSSASDTEKANMLHTLSKLGLFHADEVESWKKRAAQHGCNVEEGDHECG